MAVLFAVLPLALFAQAPADVAKWKVTSSQTEDGSVELVFTATVKDGWHIYDATDAMNATTVELADAEAIGALYNIDTPSEEDGSKVFYDSARMGLKVKSSNPNINGTLTYMACNDGMCTPPIDYDFVVDNPAAPQSETVAEASVDGPIKSKGKGIWGLILEAILWGFAMLLTPCVFPMVPMTVSFFIKGSENKAAGKFRAFMYGLFIVLLYTVPISIIIGLTWLLGGESVTADIFNWLSTHWLPNIIFFIVFMLFAASFFGAFEIVLPSKLVNKSDKNSEKKGLLGVFFMALTLVLVSFSCTGPIVGTVLIKSTSGEFWTPMVTMLAFSLAFALPFTLLALFPSMLKNLPKSGGWLNSVKVVLGFIEIALGFKFLSVADQTYHWGILPRHVYLAIWIVCFTLLGFYLLGKLKFKYDSDLKYISVTRLALAIAVFSFVVYMVPGMWGAPLKALSGYLPPLETQDFVLESNGGIPPETCATLGNIRGGTADSVGGGVSRSETVSGGIASVATLQMPHGLMGYDNIDDALAEAKATGKKVFVDVTGHGCVNCREMEARVWSDPQVLQRLRDNFVMVALYTDDKVKLPENKWLTTPEGKTLKDVGRVNSYIVRSRFGVNAQPNYIILDSDDNIVAGPRGYNLSIPGFIEFLDSAR